MRRDTRFDPAGGFKYSRKTVYFLYSLLFGGVLLAALPVYYIKLKLLRKQPLRIRERLGFRIPRPDSSRPLVWIHAVSVGEVLSVQRLVREIKTGHPDWRIGFSVLTETGHAVAAAKLDSIDHLFFVPFDIGWAVRRYFKKLRPRLLVLAESEFWPRLLAEARRTGCPVLLVNGRISDRTYRRFLRLRWAARRLFQNIDRFLVQSDADQDRLLRLGIPPEHLLVSGNLKCETRLPEHNGEENRRFKKDFGIPEEHRIVVGGSLHKGEDEQLLAALVQAREKRTDVLFVMAPRHPERWTDIERMDRGGALSIRRRTQLRAGETWDVLILDTIGELVRFYAAADAAFIGGSLVPWGGQNLLEPAFYGKPIFFGPHMKNFAALADQFLAAGAARMVRTPDELASVFLFEHPAELEAMGRRAKTVLDSLLGATQKTLAAIESLISHAKR